MCVYVCVITDLTKRLWKTGSDKPVLTIRYDSSPDGRVKVERVRTMWWKIEGTRRFSFHSCAFPESNSTQPILSVHPDQVVWLDGQPLSPVSYLYQFWMSQLTRINDRCTPTRTHTSIGVSE